MEHSFNANKFHELSDDKGSTLTIIKVKEDENSFFGGVAIPSWGGGTKFCKIRSKKMNLVGYSNCKFKIMVFKFIYGNVKINKLLLNAIFMGLILEIIYYIFKIIQ